MTNGPFRAVPSADMAENFIELRADAVTREIIDVTDGIDRVMGDRGLYTRMLKRFRHDYGNGVLPIRNALLAHNSALAHRTVHTLKGAAGMIGAHLVAERADALERILRTGSGKADAAISALDQALVQVLQVLDILIEGKPPSGVPLDVPGRALPEDGALLAQLKVLLAAGDGAAVDLVEEAMASLRVILGPAGYDALSMAVGEFDFDAALRALEQLRGKEMGRTG